MASRKLLKKEVNSLCLKVVFECFTFLEYTPSLNQENTREILAEAINLRNKLIYKINHPGNNEGVDNLKAYYNEIKEEMYRGNFGLLDRLNNLSR